ncbi:hypothetical protein DASC09_017770 [Saccharomycopsis crataegensis]|uniref:LicD/FKTN/FKRP nucleotidyltransferase domain-containing protein n=1 Tax=Saccharomycopsis crataegensis TaxID=43959 RepID=A0AAV5QI29_9ASCO|nr:hypothetical protein DASC09_017770 [Saccharomycopsis crataegensis]
MRILSPLYLPISALRRLFLLSNPKSSSAPQRPHSNGTLMVMVLAAIFISITFLINHCSSFNYQQYSSVSENLRYYLKLDRTFFRLPVFAASHVKTTKAKTPLLDPRVSINLHLQKLLDHYSDNSKINEKLTANFDWADWVDVSPADLVLKAHADILKSINEDQLRQLMTKFCYDEMADEKDPWVDDDLYDRDLFFDEQIKSIGICSAIWKKYYFPNPERIVFETDKQYFEINVKDRKSDVASLKKTYGDVKPTRDDNYKLSKKLQDTFEKNGGKLKDLHLDANRSVPMDSFKWDPDSELDELNSRPYLSQSDEKYRDFLQYAKDNAEQPHFYFTFPGLKVDRNAELHHYNFPFIRHIISHEERIAVIHHLVRSWFKFCENYGIVTWINYGNLIGWWFNGQNLPWDNDIDVQVSIQDLNRIGRELNNSLIVENPKSGNGLFWLQTNHVYSQQGAGNNFIDARFIDARTGIYIDISALWYTGDAHPPPSYLGIDDKAIKKDPEHKLPVHCKHLQFFTLDDLFPLHRTIFEGAQAYIPRKVERILNRFYGDRPFEEYKCFDHSFQSDIGIWVPDEICADPPQDLVSRFNDRGDLTLPGACNNRDLQDQFNRAKDAITLHWREVRDFYKQGKEPTEITNEDLPVFREDPFEAFDLSQREHGTRNWEI